MMATYYETEIKKLRIKILIYKAVIVLLIAGVTYVGLRYGVIANKIDYLQSVGRLK